jgi:hypothetical protein
MGLDGAVLSFSTCSMMGFRKKGLKRLDDWDESFWHLSQAWL